MTIRKTILAFYLFIVGITCCSQSTGYALLIGGTKTFDFTKYNAAPVAKADEDADKINKVLSGSDFQAQHITLLKGANARKATVMNELTAISKKMKKGDMFVFYFSGHGDTIPDTNKDELPYTFDQELILADGAIVDDALYEAFSKFPDSVRIICIVDACFSGDMYQMHDMFTTFYSRAMTVEETKKWSTANSSSCNVKIDSATFSLLSVGAAERDVSAFPFPDGSGRLTKWIYETWVYLKSKGFLEQISMLEFFKQGCIGGVRPIITVVENKNKKIFGQAPLFKL